MIKNNDWQVKGFLDKNSIKYDKLEKVFNGSNCQIASVIIDGQRYYFKFLASQDKSLAELEVDVVNYLNNRGVKVPEYYENKVFCDDNFLAYASKEVRGKPVVTDISYEVLEDVICSVAQMHRELMKYPLESIDFLDRSNDYQRLVDFRNSNANFLSKFGFDNYVEALIDKGFSQDIFSLIHADLNFNNIFAENGKVSSIIDFTDMRIGYLEDDLGKLWQNMLYVDGLDKRSLRNLLKNYEQELGRSVCLNNLLTSAAYRIIYRYYSMAKNGEEITPDYHQKTGKILKKVMNREVI